MTMNDCVILVVDDNPRLLKLSKEIFEIGGFNVMTAEDGEQALEILAEQKIDLVVTDILMPNIDGYLLCYKIRTDKKLKDIPIIIYTATYTSASDEALAMETGADRFIRKPVPMEELIREVTTLLQNPAANKHKIPTPPISNELKRQYNEGLVAKLENKNIQLFETKAKLEYSESMLREAQRIAHLGGWEINITMNHSIWSEEVFNILGMDMTSVVPSVELFLAAVHPNDKTFVTRKIKIASMAQKESEFECRLIRREKEIRYCYCKYRFEFDDDHNPVRAYGIIQDTTEKKLVEEAFREAHERLVFHIENTPLAFIEWDGQGKITAWSKQAKAIFGWTEYEAKELLNGFDLVYKEDVPAMKEVANQLQTGQLRGNRIQSRNYTKHGKIIWCEWFNSALTNEESKVVTIMSLIQDVTERKAMEETLVEYNHRYEILSKATNDAIWDWDIIHDFVVWNHGIETIFGYDFRQIASTRKWWNEKIHPEDFPRVMREIDQAFERKGSNWVSEYRYLSADRTYKHVLHRAYIIYQENVPVRVIGAMQDITEVAEYRQGLERMVEKRTQELNQALNKEKELVEMKSRFVSIASHEFRTPLSTISLASGFIRRYKDKVDAAEIDTKLNDIEKQVHNMMYLLDDVLTVGRTESGKLQVTLAELKFDLLEKLANEAMDSTGGKHKLIFSNSCRLTSMISDEKFLRNIVTNLISNAVKFSPDANEVMMRVTCDHKDLFITVKDYGIGIPPEDIKNLFASFSRGSNVSGISGTGLGLSITKKAVELLKGTIDVASSLGNGTEFTVTLPLNNG